jgi:hypothetical protein
MSAPMNARKLVVLPEPEDPSSYSSADSSSEACPPDLRIQGAAETDTGVLQPALAVVGVEGTRAGLQG